MKLGEAIYKSQQTAKPDSNKEDGKDKKDTKDDNVVDADFEEVKEDFEMKEKWNFESFYWRIYEYWGDTY